MDDPVRPQQIDDEQDHRDVEEIFRESQGLKGCVDPAWESDDDAQGSAALADQ